MPLLLHRINRLSRQGWRTLWQNPVVTRDFLLNARRGRYFVLMAAVLLAGLGTVLAAWGGDDIHNPVGRSMFYVMIGSELLIILFLLPGLVAGTLVHERDREILPLLLVTPLGPSRILLGKLLSTAGLLLLLIVSTFPLISVSVARGGVEPWEMVLGCAFLLYTGLLTALMAMLFALRANTTFQAVLLTLAGLFFCFGILLPGASFLVVLASFLLQIVFSAARYFGLITLQTTLLLSYAQIVGLLFCTLFLLLLPCVLFALARRRLHNLEPHYRETTELRQVIEFQLRQEQAAGTRHAPPLWDPNGSGDPFYARETLGFRAVQNPYTLPIWYLLVIFSQGFFWLVYVDGGKWLGIFTLVLMAQIIPTFTAGLIAGERERETWSLLRTTAASAERILLGKLRGALRHCGLRAAVLYFLPLAIGLILLAVFSAVRGIRPGPSGITVDLLRNAPPALFDPRMILHVPVLALHIFFMTLLCACVSCRQKTVYPAYGWSYFLILLYLFAPVLFWGIGMNNLPPFALLILRGLSPLLLLDSLSENTGSAVLIVPLHLVLYLAACVCLYFLSLQFLERGE